MRNAPLAWLSADDPPDAFPPVETAFLEPDGLLAAGGDLSPARLLYAYQNGIFPWYDSTQPILWWSPDPRCVLRPDSFHLSRRLRRSLSRGDLAVSFNREFASVVSACAANRPGQDGTWITPDMASAYEVLHHMGWAHSVEIWRETELVGGLYGLGIGKVFFGESMFSRQTDASKAAMLVLTALLAQQGFAILDCQVASPHLFTLGAESMPRKAFTQVLQKACTCADKCSFWPTDAGPVADFLSR